MINFLFKTSYLTLLVMLYVMCDTELQSSSVGNAISRKVLFIVSWRVTPLVDSVLT